MGESWYVCSRMTGIDLALAQQKTGDCRVDIGTARAEARGEEPWKLGRNPAARAPPGGQRRPDHQLLHAAQVVGLKKNRHIRGEVGEPREDTAAGPSDEVDRAKDCQGQEFGVSPTDHRGGQPFLVTRLGHGDRGVGADQRAVLVLAAEEAKAEALHRLTGHTRFSHASVKESELGLLNLRVHITYVAPKEGVRQHHRMLLGTDPLRNLKRFEEERSQVVVLLLKKSIEL
jgi:hypothetical protein